MIRQNNPPSDIKSLLNSPEWFKTIVESATDCILVFDRHYNCLYANQAAIDHAGTTRDKVIEKNIRDVLGHIPDFMKLWMEHIDCIFQTGESMAVGDTVHMGGRLVHSESRLSPVRDTDGAMLAVMVMYRDVSDRKLVELELESSKKNLELEIKTAYQEVDFFRRMVEASTQGIGTAYMDSRIHYQNPALLKLLGTHTMEEARKHSYEDFYTKKDRKFLRETVIPTVLAEGSWSGDIPVRSLDGNIVPTSQHIYLICNDSGEPVAFSNVVHDLTEFKRSEARFRTLVESVPVAMGISSDERIEYLNPRFSQLFGYTVDDFSDIQTWFKNAYPDHTYREKTLAEWNAHVEKAATANLPIQPLRVVITCKNATRKVSDVSGAIIGDKLYVVFIDVTERIQTEQNFRDAEKRYRELYEHLRDGSAAVNLDGTIIQFNESFQKMIGYTPEDIYQLTYRDITPEKWHAMEEGILEKQVLVRGYSDLYQKEYRRKDGTIIPVELQTYLMRDRNGNPDHLWAIVRDISDRKRTEDELKLHRDHLEELVVLRTRQLEKEIEERKVAEQAIAASLTEKEVLIREIHHRVKNNLNTVSSMLYLQSTKTQNDQITTAFQESRNRIETMARVHEHLYRSKTLTEVDMNDYLAELIEDLKNTHPERRVSTRLMVSGVMLEVNKAITCGLIVTELVSNSLKYAFVNDDDNGWIKVLLVRTQKNYRLEVADNGIGLPADLDIFKTDTLGFWLVDMLARQISGAVTVRYDQNDQNRGTVITVTFSL